MLAEGSGSERRFRLARVEPCLEVPADRLAVREDRVVAHASRRELHDPHVVVALAMAARVRRSLVKGAQTIAFSPPQHLADTYQMDFRKGRCPPVTDRTLREYRYQADGLQLQGPQSRPLYKKYRCAAIDCASAVGP